jgi:hypothetical protein
VGPEADYLLPADAKFKSEWSGTFTVRYAFVVCTRAVSGTVHSLSDMPLWCAQGPPVLSVKWELLTVNYVVGDLEN